MLILPDEVLARVGLRAVSGSLWGLWLTLEVTDRRIGTHSNGAEGGGMERPARVPADSLGMMGGEGGEMMRDEDGQGKGAPRRVSKRLRLPPLSFSFPSPPVGRGGEGGTSPSGLEGNRVVLAAAGTSRRAMGPSTAGRSAFRCAAVAMQPELHLQRGCLRVAGRGERKGDHGRIGRGGGRIH